MSDSKQIEKHFTTFLLMCNITEKAEVALTSVDLLNLNTILLSSGSRRAINVATASSELVAVHWQIHTSRTISSLQDYEHDYFYPNQSCWSRGIIGR